MPERFSADPKMNIGYQEHQQDHPHDIQKFRRSNTVTSDEDIWQEYTRESSRLQAENEILQVRLNKFFVDLCML